MLGKDKITKQDIKTKGTAEELLSTGAASSSEIGQAKTDSVPVPAAAVAGEREKSCCAKFCLALWECLTTPTPTPGYDAVDVTRFLGC